MSQHQYCTCITTSRSIDPHQYRFGVGHPTQESAGCANSFATAHQERCRLHSLASQCLWQPSWDAAIRLRRANRWNVKGTRRLMKRSAAQCSSLGIVLSNCPRSMPLNLRKIILHSFTHGSMILRTPNSGHKHLPQNISSAKVWNAKIHELEYG